MGLGGAAGQGKDGVLWAYVRQTHKKLKGRGILESRTHSMVRVLCAWVEGMEGELWSQGEPVPVPSPLTLCVTVMAASVSSTAKRG